MIYDPSLSSPAAGIFRYWSEDKDGNAALVTRQNHEAILDQNKAMATHNDGYSASREFRRVASIPLSLLEKWREEDGVDALHPDNRDYLRKKLNSSDYAFLRTAPGRL